ncbi:alpha/beta fold hydrolase [Candidatus Woesearchaeota archaeon]|nr:MAG: alpha/beta fold hydrolase [Candidatus Woesearchaeota archaeon]
MVLFSMFLLRKINKKATHSFFRWLKVKPRIIAGLILVALLILSGCSAQQETSTTQKEQTQKEEFTLTTTDGVILHGTKFSPENTPQKSVLLLHMLGRSKEDWEPIVPLLIQNGYEVFTVDLRGMGESTTRNGKKYTFKEFSPLDYQKMREDMLLIASTIDKDQFDIIGASIGANLALDYAASAEGNMRVRKMILMSPGENYRGIETVSKAKNVKAETFILASEEDSYAADSSRNLAERISQSSLQVYSGLGHGTNMLSDESARQQIIDFLMKNP